MDALAVIECFDVVEDLAAGLGAGFKVAAIDQFQLERGPEAFHGGVVLAVGAAAHGGEEARGFESGAEVGGVLDPSVCVEQQAR